MRKSVFLLLVIVSSFLVSFSFPPHDLGILAWFCLVPLFYVLRQSSTVVAACLAFLFGYLFALGAFYWGINIAEINVPIFLFLMVPIFSIYFFIFGLFYRLISKSIGSWIIIGAPALWVALEYARSNLFFISWPLNLIGHTQYHYLPIIQIADITGVYGISFLVVMVNQLLSQLPDFFAMKRIKQGDITGYSNASNLVIQILTVVLLLIITLFYGWSKMGVWDNSKRMRVALVQANVLTRDNMPLPDQAKHIQAYALLTRNAALRKPDLIIWPASSIPAPLHSRIVRFTVRQLAIETGSYILVGGAGHEKFGPKKDGFLPYSNSEFLINPSGHLAGQYNKIRLLPFNEYLPFKGIIRWPIWLTTLQDSFIPGDKYTLFQVSGASFGTPICWENMFPDLFRNFVKEGAQFMVSVTNEGFLGHTSGPYQTLAMNIFRAVENRVAVVRANTTGVSAFINPDGAIIERVRDSTGKDRFVSGVIVRDLPLSNKKTIYTIYGDIFAYIVIGIAVLIVMVSHFSKRESVPD